MHLSAMCMQKGYYVTVIYILNLATIFVFLIFIYCHSNYVIYPKNFTFYTTMYPGAIYMSMNYYVTVIMYSQYGSHICSSFMSTVTTHSNLNQTCILIQIILCKCSVTEVCQ